MGAAKPDTAMPGEPDEDDSCVDIGYIIAEHRYKAGRTRQSVADAVGISSQHLEKMEKGSRTFTLAHLEAIAVELGVFPLVREQLMALAMQPESVRTRIAAGEKISPEAIDLALLDSITTPACLYLPGTFHILASNAAFDRTFPGACDIGNLTLWLLTDQTAKQVLPHPYWEQEATLHVGAATCLAPGLTTRRTFARFHAELAATADFARLNRRVSPDEVVSTTIVTRDLDDGNVREWYRHTIASEFPHQRPWRTYVLAPAVASRSAFIVPSGMARRRGVRAQPRTATAVLTEKDQSPAHR